MTPTEARKYTVCKKKYWLVLSRENQARSGKGGKINKVKSSPYVRRAKKKKKIKRKQLSVQKFETSRK
jgi:hypothetical protein